VQRRAVYLLIGLFLLNGFNLVALKAFRQAGVVGEDGLFLAFLFGRAAVLGIVVWYPRRQGTRLADLLPGVALGLTNAGANLAMVAALRALPGFIAFPFHSAVGLVVSTAAARLIWGNASRALRRRASLWPSVRRCSSTCRMPTKQRGGIHVERL
jgi:hypothetical protein